MASSVSLSNRYHTQFRKKDILSEISFSQHIVNYATVDMHLTEMSSISSISDTFLFMKFKNEFSL